MSLLKDLTVVTCVFCSWLYHFQLVNGQGIYSIVAPGTIIPNRDYKVTVAVYHIQQPVTLKIGITGPSYNESQIVEFPTAQDLKEVVFKLPALSEGDYNLTAKGKSGLNFTDSIGLYFKHDAPIVFILTDKDNYMPGDKVSYRVLLLNEELKPDLYAEDLVICLKNPKRNVIDKARGSKVTDGVYSGQFQLSENAPLGQWKITLENAEGEEYRSHRSTFSLFEVISDDLPRFSVQIDVPKYVSIKDNVMKVVVKAKHLYGSPVNGKGTINIDLKTAKQKENRFNRTITASGDLSEGQVTFNINLTDIAKQITPIKSTYMVIIRAMVEDDLSGEKYTEVAKVFLLPHRHIVTCADFSCLRPWKEKDSKVFIKITNLDGSLVNDSQSLVKLIYNEGTEKLVSYFRKYLEKGEKKHFEFVGQLDKSGLYVFKANLSDLPQKDDTLPYYDISVEYDGEVYKLQQTFSQMFGSMIDAHNAYFTPRIDVNFFLQIHGRKDSKGYPAPLIAGDEFQVTLNSKDPIKYFIYTIVARGLILHTERVDFSNPMNVYNFTVKSTHLTSPFFYIYAYYVDGEGILQYTNSQYKVIVSLPNEISISAPKTGYPKEEINIQIKTEPNSFVGLLAVDERISGKRRLENIRLGDMDWELEANQLLNALAAEERQTEFSRNYEIDMNHLNEHLDDFYLHTYKRVPGSRLGLITITNAKISERIFRYFDKVKNSTIQKTLKVIPETTTQYKNQVILFNLTKNQKYNRSFHLDFPKGMIKDSDNIEVSLFGDPLGLIVENLDNSLPSGTGELIMSKMVVNFLVWDYLNKTNKLYNTLDAEIKNNLRVGYQNILNYHHEDGNFSYFGPQKGNGSIWLTSFVLRYLSDIQEVIYIDNSILKKGFEFLLNRQNEDGSFTDEFEYFSRKDSSLFLTSSVLLSLQKGKNSNMEAIKKAVTFIKSQVEETNFSLAKTMAIYALQKSKETDSDKLVDQLKSLVQKKDDRTWWAEDVQKESPQDVEITSYALLSLMESEQVMSELDISTIRWLLAQRNIYGEFVSSQKNVVGLTALVKFSKKIDYKAVDLEVSVSGEDKSDRTVLRYRNDMIAQMINFPQGTKFLEIQAKGSGLALFQISYQYNSVEPWETNPSFKIRTKVKTRTLFSKLEVNVCVEFVEEGEAKTSNLAFIEVSLPSGYITDKASLKVIQHIKGVQFVQTKNEESVVIVYLESLAKNENKCIPIEAFRAFEVTNLKPSPVVIYDNCGRKATEYYQFKSELT
ncbi:thioester-containing protein 1 allele R1-like [Drosophila takahashii]|uniref:thioester-containing protein 1 allele R1-like n=1 Tax=Drosophila takahashii TaxID=29030 RepID=UPI003898F324